MIVQRAMARRPHPAPLMVVLALLGSTGCEPPPPTHPTDWGNPDASVLGSWAQAELHYVDAQGGTSPALGWRAELWLPDECSAEGCRFSCASTYLSAVVTAKGPATFVQLIHKAGEARRLGSGNATLSVAGAAPLAQITMPTDRFQPYEATEYYESYLFAFPATNPPTWEYLEATIPIAGSSERLRVRFTRGSS